MTAINKQWLLKRRPQGDVTRDDFEYVETPIPAVGEGEVRVRHLYLSIDPTNRLWTREADGYLPAVPLNTPMRGNGIGIVEESRHERFKAGDIVGGFLQWQTYAVVKGKELGKIRTQEGTPLTFYHGLLGAIGFTAFFGLMDIGKPKAGETIVVSAAAGAVGSLVCQIGKKEGCRVVGLAGSDDKCQWLIDELGIDAAINYKTEDLAQSMAKHCPDGIDIYFDNVGGDILDAALGLINVGARIPLCGMISTYNESEPQPGPKNLIQVLNQRARLEGFIVIDYLPRAKEAFEYLVPAYERGEIQFRTHVVEGIDQVPDALTMLFKGKNEGKLIVKIDPDWQD